MNILELCKCAENQICPFCKILSVICIAVASGVIGFFIGKKKREKNDKEISRDS